MPQEFSNWSGKLRFTPGRVERPTSEEALAALVRQAAAEGRTVRAYGAGHSSSPLVATQDILVSLEHFEGIESYDQRTCQATVKAGTNVHKLGNALYDIGMAMENLGDVDYQTIAGAISTGTHGSGKKLRNLENHVIGVRMVTASGEIVTWDQERNENLVRAARVALGSLGIFTALKMKLLPAYQLVRRDYCAHVDDCLPHLEELLDGNRNFDFYWYPRSDLAKLRTLNLPGEGMQKIPYGKCVNTEEGWSHQIISQDRVLRFDEMEYMLPAEAGPECFREVRKRVKEKHRKLVAWRTLYRHIAADDAYLSPAFGQNVVAISVHQNAALPYEDYFNDVEAICRAYGGRPHWGKIFSLKADQLRPLYPEWDRFHQIRRQVDPKGLFLNRYLQEIFEGVPDDRKPHSPNRPNNHS